MTTGPSRFRSPLSFLSRYRNSNFPPFFPPTFRSTPSFLQLFQVGEIIRDDRSAALSRLNSNYTLCSWDGGNFWYRYGIAWGLEERGGTRRDGNWMRFLRGRNNVPLLEVWSERAPPREKSRCRRGHDPSNRGSTFPPPLVADSPWRAPGSPDRGNFICLGVVVENIEMRKIGIARNSSPEWC